jgi:LuxR family transcriptional regulator, maltose regulon positive regulatory protein
MSTIILESKLHIPIQPQRITPRHHLLTSLEHRIHHHKIAFISAPAGYGKTTLLAEWVRASSLPVAWLSITEEENDVESLLRYLLAAWERIYPDIAEATLGILLGAQMPDIKTALRAFLDAANELTEHLIFVLDDYHLIEVPEIHDAVGFLLDHLPAHLHFILASRGEPPLPLSRYRARGQLMEIGAGDLRFTLNEAVDFLSHSMGLDLAPDEIESLNTKTEGWIAGLKLAALTLRRRQGLAESQSIVSGRERFIADFLSEEILDQLPRNVQDFLLRSSLLDRLCGSLCDAVTGQKNCQSMLESLERENLFIVPLDERREWYRYHSLFADFLRGELARLHPDEIPELHRQAAEWYLSQELPEGAFHHAVVAEDPGLVTKIFVKYLGAKLTGGEIKVVTRWINSLPQKWFSIHPELALARAALMMTTGAVEEAINRLDEIEQKLNLAEMGDRYVQLARTSAIRCFLACYQNDLKRAEAYADQALTDLPEEDVSFRFGIYGALGDTYRRNGLWKRAREWYLKGLDFAHAPEVGAQFAHLYGALADLELWQGRLQSAAGYWRKALAAIREQENWGRIPLPVIGWVYIRMGEILYEWNRLAEARDHVLRGLKRAEIGGDVRSLIAGYVIAARLKLADGRLEEAMEYLEKARPLKEEAAFPDWTSQFERIQLELWLAQDKLRAAVNWSDEMLQSAELENRPESVVTQLAMARVLIVKGDAQSLERALASLKRLGETAGQQDQTGVHIEALALQAISDWKRGAREDAMVSLEHALRLAEQEGYVRLFVDLGLPIARLLQETRSRRVMQDYVGNLLEAFGNGLVLPAPEMLPEPLTAREQEVLKLLAAGLTNPEIAKRLVISSETVKKHTGHIYNKLGVSNRTQAVTRARELDLFG